MRLIKGWHRHCLDYSGTSGKSKDPVGWHAKIFAYRSFQNLGVLHYWFEFPAETLPWAAVGAAPVQRAR